MPIARAARLCAHAAFLPVDMAKYRAVSVQVMGMLADFSPLVEPVSVDEAFVDLTGTEGLFGSALDAVRAIKRRIREETCLTASAGLASNKFVAKVASELEKPDGLVAVAAGGEARFLAPLPVELIWGVGRVTAKALRELGLTTIGRLQSLPRPVLARRSVTPDLSSPSVFRNRSVPRKPSALTRRTPTSSGRRFDPRQSGWPPSCGKGASRRRASRSSSGLRPSRRTPGALPGRRRRTGSSSTAGRADSWSASA